MSIAVIGIGQRMRGDDAAGLEAVALWQREHPDCAQDKHVRTEFCELPGLGLIDFFDNAEVVVIADAVQSGSPPGSIHIVEILQGDEVDTGSMDAHGWGAAETIQLFRRLYPESPPHKILLVGIELAQIDLGKGLSAEVQRALPQAAAAIQDQVTKHLAAMHKDAS